MRIDHICYINNSTIDDVERVKMRGVKIIISLVPAVALNNKRVIFYIL